MAELYRHRVPDQTLAEALELARHCGPRPVALLYSPRACLLAVVEGGGAKTASGAVDLSQVYEARVFGPDAELRWNHAGEGRGPAVLLAGRKPDDLAMETVKALACQATRYYLWGEGLGDSDGGWGNLATARIGRLSVPVEVGAKQRVVLNAVEYFAAEPEHGNVEVIEERLAGLEVK